MKRQGNTGVWTYVMTTPSGEVIATSAWGSNYLFDQRSWEALPIIEEPKDAA
jgi:hypothetical protein